MIIPAHHRLNEGEIVSQPPANGPVQGWQNPATPPQPPAYQTVQQPPMYFPPAQPPAPPKKPVYQRVWFWIVIVVVIAIIIGIATGTGSNKKPTVPLTGERPTVGLPTAGPATEASQPAPTEAAPSTPAEPTQPSVPTIGNGDHIVGTDFPAGLYRAEVEPSFIPLCTVSQDDVSGDIMNIANADEGSVIFAVQDVPGSVVSFSGCTNIGLAADMIRANPATITNGDWLVGAEIPAGRYQCTVDTDSIMTLGTVTQYGPDGSVMDIDNGTEGNVIFTVKDSAGSYVGFSGCATITQV